VGGETFLFWLIGGATAMCAVAVVLSRDIVHAAVWLLLALGWISGLYFLLGATFVGAVQLLVYCGGTLVLVVFGVMLTARSVRIKMQVSAGQWTVAVIVGLLMFVVVASCIVATVWPVVAETAATDPADDTGPTLIGQALLTRYLLPFEIVSVHLVVVLIGAAYLARIRKKHKKKRSPAPAGGGS